MSNTLILIFYDITNDRRRRKLYKLLSRFGDPAQYSLFHCLITGDQLEELKRGVSKIIRTDEMDSVLYYEICGECGKRISMFGRARNIEEKLTYIY